MGKLLLLKRNEMKKKDKKLRVPCYTHVTIKDEDDVFYGMTGDISVGGAFVATFDKLPEEGDIRLSFTLPEDRAISIQVNGRVVWLNSKEQPMSGSLPEGFGVEFTGIPQEEISAINEFIEKRSGKEFVSKS
jgi:uncharacterized protein (TIGR02266 family)